tara:strand:+ start:371 stop:589 length:219 start_codon:yes stop_codon:yes gene_type:complete
MAYNKIDIEEERYSRAYIIRFYKEQLEKFQKIGIGNKTEFNTVVTQNLINITIRRLRELKSLYNASNPLRPV